MHVADRAAGGRRDRDASTTRSPRLAALGAAARERLAGALVVGITGSSGKTGTKDLTAGALGRKFHVHASPGSFNNEIGLPFTLLGAPAATEAVVLEMGARFPGNIADLCAIARPDVGVITNIGLSHAGLLGGPDGIARVKGELLEALAADGVAVLDAGDPATPGLAARTAASRAHRGVVGRGSSPSTRRPMWSRRGSSSTPSSGRRSCCSRRGDPAPSASVCGARTRS